MTTVLFELLVLSVAGLVGVFTLHILHWSSWAPASHGGTVIMVSTISTYWIIERVLERRRRIRGQEPPPVVVPAERKSWMSTSGIVLVHVAGAVVGAMIIETAQELAFGPVTETTILDRMEHDDRAAMVELAIAVILLAPLCEEVLFRGFFFRRLRAASPVAAWTLTTIAFAAQHGISAWLPIYIWISLVFTHAYVRTGRVAAGISTHIGYNAFAVLQHLLALGITVP